MFRRKVVKAKNLLQCKGQEVEWNDFMYFYNDNTVLYTNKFTFVIGHIIQIINVPEVDSNI